jgi:hypothetical protein
MYRLEYYADPINELLYQFEFMRIAELDPATSALVCEAAEDVFDVLAVCHPGASSQRPVRKAILEAIVEMVATGTRNKDVLCAYGLTVAIKKLKSSE